jgi:transcriptional regulator with XRE-family HTH domain
VTQRPALGHVYEEETYVKDSQPRSIGSFIRQQRQLARLSLREMARLSSVSNAYLSQVERGLHEPSISVLRSIADALGVPLESLLTRAGVLEGDAGGAVRDTEAAILNDPELSEPQRVALLSVYRSFVPPRGRR